MNARLAPPIPDLSMKPGARFGPLATDSDGREPDHLRDFFQAETTKESQLDDLSFPRVELGQCTQCIVYRHKVSGPVRHDARRVCHVG